MSASPDRNTGQSDTVITASKSYEESDKSNIVAKDTNKSELRHINPLTPNNPFSGRTTPLASKRCIIYIYSTNTGSEYF